MRISLSIVLGALGLGAAFAAGCSSSDTASGAGGSHAAMPAETTIAPDTQRPGDAAQGYQTLIDQGYITCGIPLRLYQQFAPPTASANKLAGRTGQNADLPYYFTATTTKSGVEVVNNNCLACHASKIRGELIVGLGAANADFTTDQANNVALVAGLAKPGAEKDELQKFLTRAKAIGPYATPNTMGINPADSFTAALFAHHDPKTLAWSDDPLIELPPPGVVPVDVPPWWRMSKKHAMFYNASGRGDHARIEMTAALLCTDSVEEAQAIDASFVDVRAYIETLKPPAYPLTVDEALADEGRTTFEKTCSRCHGTYGSGGSYPNLLISLAEVGTDSTLASGAGQFASDSRFVDWYNQSFWGQIARLEPKEGYVAPPLDGIWATAPFLHNGSIPTIEALLDSTKRPTYWSRTFDSNDFDEVALGWNFTALDAGQNAEPNATKRKKIYDTTELGASNAGHRYGDALTDSERKAVIEYLKTL